MQQEMCFFVYYGGTVLLRACFAAQKAVNWVQTKCSKRRNDMAYTKAELKRDLAAMGLTGNETILIHSSMRSIGPVEGGAHRTPGSLH